MVVVGGRSSANTKELTRLCEIAGTPAIQIESVRDLADPGVFADAKVVGVTGGTAALPPVGAKRKSPGDAVAGWSDDLAAGAPRRLPNMPAPPLAFRLENHCSCPA